MADTTAPGPILAAERMRQGLSIGDIAAKLRMSVQQVEALEHSDYQRLPTGTFLRGFVRSYSKLLGMDPELLLRQLEETHAAGRRPSIVVPTQNIKITAPNERFSTTRARGLLLATLLVALCAGAAYWWLYIRPAQGAGAAVTVSPPVEPAPLQPSVTQPATIAPEQAAPSAAATEPAKSADSEPVATPPVAELVQKAQSEAPRRPAVAPGTGALRFSFTGESWVEVVEGSGKTLVSRRFNSGETELVVGKLPVSVVIGNAPAVRLLYNDFNFDLAPHTRVAVARFTLK